MTTSLDVPEQQILIFFGQDRIPWHHRLSLERVSQARWVMATPTLEVEVVDLDVVEDLRPLGREQVFTDACRLLLVFNELIAVEINEILAQARRLADILGVPTDGDVMSGRRRASTQIRRTRSSARWWHRRR